MKKLLSLVLIGTLVLSLTACGNSSSKDNSSSKETTTTKKEEKKEPLNLTGTWKSDENEGAWMEATISDNVISIDWVTDEGKTKATYWVGSYDVPTTATSEYSWVSNNDHEKTKNALLASNDDTKEFTYKNDILSFTASMQGDSKVVELKNNNMKNTNHDKNLDYIYDNHPEMLDDYIDVYENSILAVDHTVSPEDMIDITEMIIAFEKKKH